MTGFAEITRIVDNWCDEFTLPISYSARKVLVDRLMAACGQPPEPPARTAKRGRV